MLDARESCDRNISNFLERFDRKVAVLKRIKEREDYLILRDADVIGMTTTGNIYGLNGTYRHYAKMVDTLTFKLARLTSLRVNILLIFELKNKIIRANLNANKKILKRQPFFKENIEMTKVKEKKEEKGFKNILRKYPSLTLTTEP